MPESNNNLINLSFSMHAGPGTFALLLGSGISQGAGVPTGWDIVLDLIRRIATLEGELEVEDPEQWFRERYGEPRYSDLIGRLAPSQIERQSLLKKYIEPDTDQRQNGLRVPSLAHKSIAGLVKNGSVRVILTTNIDQLIEASLSEVGITPTVIFNDDSLNGAMPYVHNNCTIIKLHGDYMDTRIRNTPDELADYSEGMNALLDRIFDEFGSIVCGWSAKWDVALRDALFRKINRRFSTYWVYPQGLSEDAVRLKDHLYAIPIQIEDADHFFLKLLENIEALKKFERPHPLSTPLAIAHVKKYIAEDKYRIQLHDLLQDEINRIYDQLRSDHFSIRNMQIPSGQNKTYFQNRMHDYEELLKKTIGMFSTYAYFGSSHSEKPIVDIIERLMEKPEQDGLILFNNLQCYPAYLMNYSIGIAALASENYEFLFSLLTKPEINDGGRQRMSLQLLNTWNIFNHDGLRFIPTLPGNEVPYTPASDYLCRFLFGELKALKPNQSKFEEIFDIFEYLRGLTYVDRIISDISGRVEGPYGRFKWRSRHLYNLAGITSPIENFFNLGLTQGNEWSLLKSGFFGGSAERLIECKSAYDRYLESVGQHWI